MSVPTTITQVCVFTIGRQDDWPFSGPHESLDGGEETDVVVEYDIDLWEQMGLEGGSDLMQSRLHRVTVVPCKCVTSSNRISDVAVSLFGGAVCSEADNRQPDVWLSGLSAGDRPLRCNRSALAFILK